MHESSPFIRIPVIIIIRRFSIGHLDSIEAYHALLGCNGFSVTVVGHAGFKGFLSQDIVSESFSTTIRNIRLSKRSSAILLGPSLRGLLDFIYLRLLTSVRCIYVLHEPLEPLRNYLKSGFTLWQTIRIGLIGLANNAIIFLSHRLIVHSEKASNLYASSLLRKVVGVPYLKYPLIFRDQIPQIQPLSNRNYISYIGTIAADHNFIDFLNYAEWLIENNILGTLKIAIITSSIIDERLEKRISHLINSERLILLSGKPLSNSEISSFYETSLVIWAVYKRCTQSAVIPRAYMSGTPILASEQTAREYFEDFSTGRLINDSTDCDKITKSIGDIVSEFDKYSQKSRLMYLKNFDFLANGLSLVEYLKSEKVYEN